MPAAGHITRESHHTLVAIVQSGGMAADAAAADLINAYSPLIWRHCGYVPRGLQDDAYSVGVIALLTAIRRYDPSRGASLGTYATPYVRGAIQRFNRQELTRLQMESLDFKEGSISDIDSRSRLGDTSVNGADLDSVLTVRTWWERQPKKCQDLLHLHYHEGFSLAEIARAEGVTRAATSQRLSRILRRARSDLSD